MITSRQIDKMLHKLRRFAKSLEKSLFVRVGETTLVWYETSERLHCIPDKSLFTERGGDWGGAGNFCWFAGAFEPLPEHEGKRLYIMPDAEGHEGLLFVDGEPFGLFTRRNHSGNGHYCALLTPHAIPGKKIEIAIEYYAGTKCAGTQPFEETRDGFNFKAGDAHICVRDDLIFEFLFDLRALLNLIEALDRDSYMRADATKGLFEVYKRLYLDSENIDDAVFRAALSDALPVFKKILSVKNSESAPFVGIVGHSHLDTAWLWTLDETIKKCARTFSNQLALMEQYPEYMFVQSSAYHSEMVRRNYPSLFEKIRQKVAEGRYEPNGGVWVECDCNIVSGESLARQFLWGQLYTREQFGYTADAFWLPDTFGYNAAIPQIMLKSNVKYFLTTKMSWNDQNRFPYDTFYWEGIDGSRVLSHFNCTHCWPDPVTLKDAIITVRYSPDPVQEKTVNNKRLIAFGFGDGGGGPMFEMLESARRVKNLDGVPRTEYTTVSDFMKSMEESLYDPSVYSGELYLELHRGTLTNQHEIKRNMRKCEIALHDLEYASVRDALTRGENPDPAPLRSLIETMLVNQFHDILPGTSIPEVHRRSVKEMAAVIREANEKTEHLLTGVEADSFITVTNTLSFARNDVVYIDAPGISVDNDTDTISADVRQQLVETLNGGKKLAVTGITLQPFSSESFKITGEAEKESSPFMFDKNKNVLTTPHATVTFDENGAISSFLDKNAHNRELRGDGYPLNTFLMAEDVPHGWDNWDIDADIEYKFAPAMRLISRAVISDGSVEFRLRSVYQISVNSTVTQDMIFYADSPEVRFETLMDWHDRHRFLKTAFDTTVHSGQARYEIQFGHINRTTARSTDIEKAKFELCCHKYVDLSESRYGISILNDSKYGISVKGGQMRLSLHKGGQRPDNEEGDMGRHMCVYAFLPHTGGFSTENVVRPAYKLNYSPVITKGRLPQPALLTVSSPTVIAETIKPCENNQNAFIIRLYECEGARALTDINVPGAKSITETNILEDAIEEVIGGDTKTCDFHPFEIKTLLVRF